MSAWYASIKDELWQERGTIRGTRGDSTRRNLRGRIVDLFMGDKGQVSTPVVDAFLESLGLRAPQHISDRTIRVVEQLIDSDHWTTAVWEKTRPKSPVCLGTASTQTGPTDSCLLDRHLSRTHHVVRMAHRNRRIRQRERGQRSARLGLASPQDEPR